ncbi:MAG: 30S ribosomal protein S21 [Candidatus Pelagibacter sp. TMED197]|nr:MAG: 30S ribosomal protein S21 [Candidatus Pelagibacter sp. TMED197]
MTITVEVRKGNLEKAMRVLKKKVAKEGIIKTLKQKQYYIKPSEIKREKKKEGIKNFKKKMKKLELTRGY